VHDRSGIVVAEDKAYLAVQRLGSVAKAAGLTIEALVAAIDRDHALTTQIVEAMTNNETTFFRDAHPFVRLGDTILPELAAATPKSEGLRIWCAAVASGQEAYTLGITILESPELAARDIRIHGTDLATKMITRAKAGCYTDFETSRGLCEERRERWFSREGAQWKVKPELRKMTTFSRMNLRDPWPELPLMHVILLRNVLIYLDDETRQAVASRTARQLAPGGYLILGAVERLSDNARGLERRLLDKTLCYQRPR
jgi:chemotaxis protein methyltransferase CheR